MSDPDPTQPFFLIVADYDRGLFSVEGPMTARQAAEQGRLCYSSCLHRWVEC
jgi:hypothetical protein